MQGFEEAAVLISTDGLGYRVEQRVEPKPAPLSAAAAAAALLDPHADLAAVRAEKRRREIEMMSTAQRRTDISDVFSGGGDIDAAAEAAHAPGPTRHLSLRDQLAANKAAADEAWKEKNNPFRPPPGLSEEDFQAYQDLEQARRTKHEQQREQEQADFTQFQIALQQKELARAEVAKDEAVGPVGGALSLPEIDQLDPSLGFSRLAERSKSGEGGGNVGTVSGSADTSGASALLSPLIAAVPADATAASASLPPLVLLKKRTHSHSQADSSAAAAAGGDEKPAKRHKKKKDKKDKTEAATATAAADPPAAAAPTALAGLVAYGSDDDE